MPAAFPTGAELTTHLQNMGVLDNPVPSPNPLYNAASLAGRAQRAWERATRYQPFLAVLDTRYYDPPGPVTARLRPGGYGGGGRVLRLDTGIASESSLVVTIGVDENGNGGTVLTKNLQYTLNPLNAINEGEPYKYIEFASPVIGKYKSIKVTGILGFMVTLDDEVYNVVMNLAAGLALPQFGASLTGGAVKVKIENDSFDFTGGAYADQANMWVSDFQQKAREYRR